MFVIIDSILVPRERVGKIRDDQTAGKIEKALNVKLSFEENSVLIEGDGLELMAAKNVVKAIGRGFSSEHAFRLFKEEEFFETIELGDFNENRMKVLKSRLIGTGGKTWRMIENLTGCSMSVYGKTVSLIGTYEQLNIAKEAVQMIIRGNRHSSVYSYLFKTKVE